MYYYESDSILTEGVIPSNGSGVATVEVEQFQDKMQTILCPAFRSLISRRLVWTALSRENCDTEIDWSLRRYQCIDIPPTMNKQHTLSAYERIIHYPASHVESNARGPALLPGVVCTYTSCYYHEDILTDLVGADKSFHLCGGFVIDSQTLMEWGSRLGDPGDLSCDPNTPNAMRMAMRRVQSVLEKYRPAKVHSFGPDIGWQERGVIITTQSAYFSHALDPDNLPQFERGEKEKQAEELLREHGITNAQFRTVNR